MRGSLKRKIDRHGVPMSRNGKPVWRIIVTEKYVVEGDRRRQRQAWSTFVGSKREAQDHVAELVGKVKIGEYCRPSRLTLHEHLKSWHALTIVGIRRPATVRAYGLIVRIVGESPIGSLRVDALRASHLEGLYRTMRPSVARLAHAVIHRALRRAARERLIPRNVAADVEDRPACPQVNASRAKCLDAHHASALLAAAGAEGMMWRAYFTLAVDIGARKAETLGLKWDDFDDARGTLRVERQLDAGGAKPEFGPVKTKQARTVRLAETTVARLRDHRKTQNELKMKNRTHYADLGLIFAMEYDHLTKGSDRLGHPLRRSVVDRKLAQLLRSVGAPRVTPHALRHTSASILLGQGVPAHAVAARLGHASPVITLGVYAHALAEQQEAGARVMDGVLAGPGGAAGAIAGQFKRAEMG